MAAGSKAGQVALWILMAMLAVGLGGFGITSFSGAARSIGKVDGEDIDTNTYYRGLQNALSTIQSRTGQPVTMSEALGMGLDAAVRQELITRAALDATVARMGVSVGDARLATEIQTFPSFRGSSGGFDPTSYRRALQDSGLKEAAFEAQLRKDLAGQLVETAISTGMAGSPVVATALLAHIDERRSISILPVTVDMLPEPVPAPDDAAIRAYYDAHPDEFTRPEIRHIDYAVLHPDELAKEITVDAAEVRDLYDLRRAQYIQPERRLVERLVYPDANAATAARNRLDAGQVEFEDLVAERGLELADIDLGTVDQDDLGAAGDTVFAMEEPGVVGPLESSLGPALFRMNGVLAAQETTFDAVQDSLRDEIARDAARRSIAGLLEEIEDLLAGGAMLADLARDAGMTLASIEFSVTTRDGIAADERFREQAARIGEGDFLELTRLADGGLAVLELRAIDAPALHPLDEVRETAAAAVQVTATRTALQERLAAIATAVTAGSQMTDFGTVTTHAGLARGAPIPGAPADLAATVFTMVPDGLHQMAAGDFVALIRLDEILPADQDSPEAAALKAAFVAQQGAEFGADAVALFNAALVQGARITLNDGAINSIHSQMR